LYTIETRTVDGWYPLGYDAASNKMQTFETLEKAAMGLERHLDNLWFINKVIVPFNSFRVVKVKQNV
jgi:hypothetical protein